MTRLAAMLLERAFGPNAPGRSWATSRRTWYAARRAARVNPVIALRAE
jgi:hypothetical protein